MFLKRFVINFKMVVTAVATLPPKVPALNVNVSLRPKLKNFVQISHTGKYISEALILASTNPQYDKRLFIELQVQYM